jgi:hypothetical protein
MSIPGVVAGAFDSFIKNYLTKKISYADLAPKNTTPTTQPTVTPPVNKANPVPKDWQPAIQSASSMYNQVSPTFIKTVLGMESSMGTDTKNQKTDLGKYGWIGGHINSLKGAWQDTLNKYKANPNLDYKAIKAKVPGIMDLSTPTASIHATASVLQQIKDNHPGISDSDAYFKYYNTVNGTDTPQLRQKFNDLNSSYSQNDTSTSIENQ